jgi:hypothetical protein
VTANIGGGRRLRVCDLCGGVDDHPRHVVAGSIPGDAVAPQISQDIADRVLEAAPREDATRLLRDLYDPSTSDRHMDCCRQAGCPDGTCDLVTAGAENKRGAALLKHLTSVRESLADDAVKGE